MAEKMRKLLSPYTLSPQNLSPHPVVTRMCVVSAHIANQTYYLLTQTCSHHLL